MINSLIHSILILGLAVANVILQPVDQLIFQGQNAFFDCLLNGTNGRLIPVQWSVQMVESPRVDITRNSTQYLLLPPANSRLIIVQPSRNFFIVTCSGVGESYGADLTVQGS